VREKIVAALGERKDDAIAAEAMVLAMSDESVKIRLLAAKSIPTTGLSRASVLAVGMNDPDESVRVAVANTLGSVGSSECKHIVLKALANTPNGVTLKALIESLPLCSKGKDLIAVGAILPLLKTASPEVQQTICESLVRLTMNKADRKAWNGADWEKWYAHINKREEMRNGALHILEEARKNRDIKNAKNFDALIKQTDEALAVLENCEKMCETYDDSEDIPMYERLRKDYSDLRYHFQKFKQPKD
jgi:HEAT repeat protein